MSVGCTVPSHPAGMTEAPQGTSRYKMTRARGESIGEERTMGWRTFCTAAGLEEATMVRLWSEKASEEGNDELEQTKQRFGEVPSQ